MRLRAFCIAFYYQGLKTGIRENLFFYILERTVGSEIVCGEMLPETCGGRGVHMEVFFSEFIRAQYAGEVHHPEVEQAITVAEISEIYEEVAVVLEDDIAELKVAVDGGAGVWCIADESGQFVFLRCGKERVLLQQPDVSVLDVFEFSWIDIGAVQKPAHTGKFESIFLHQLRIVSAGASY